MRAARGRRMGFSSMLLLVLLFLASPRHATGYSVSNDSGEETHDLSLLTKGDDGKFKPVLPTTSTDTSTQSTGETTKSTDETTQPTFKTSTLPPTKDPSTTVTPSEDLQLYEETRIKLNEIDETLDKFLVFVTNNRKSIEETPADDEGGRRDHPAAWWEVGEAARASATIDDICDTSCTDCSADLCKELQDHLENTDNLVLSLENDVNDWDWERYGELKSESDDLSRIYYTAEEDGEAFKASVDADAFTSVIGDMKKDVQSSLDTVDDKIKSLTTDEYPGSVALVAVIGTVGGLLVVSLISVMVYEAVKRSKLKKKYSAPYKKLQGENIPMGGFSSDGPADPRQAPRMEPYRNSPLNRSDHYSNPYGPKSEPNYRGPTVTRVGQGLPRTHL